jgi:hypothetical protein
MAGCACPLAVQLGLELCGFQTVELADGTQKEDLVFSGEVIFGDRRGEVDISLTSGGDTLAGIGLLANSVATIDLVGQTIEIVQK